jgi:hypothetical protein
MSGALYVIQANGHTWIYCFRTDQRREFLQRVYADSRNPEAGFSLWHVIQALKV